MTESNVYCYLVTARPPRAFLISQTQITYKSEVPYIAAQTSSYFYHYTVKNHRCMMPKLSKLFSRSGDNQVDEKEAKRMSSSDDSASSHAPSYQEPPPDYDGENVIPPPDLTAGFSNLNIGANTGSQPSELQCIAHLKVLECFYRLRQSVGSTDGLFGIENKVSGSRPCRECRTSFIPNDKAQAMKSTPCSTSLYDCNQSWFARHFRHERDTD